MLNFWKTIQSKKSQTLSANTNNVGLSFTSDGLMPLKDFEFSESGMYILYYIYGNTHLSLLFANRSLCS